MSILCKDPAKVLCKEVLVLVAKKNLSITFVSKLIFVIDHLCLSPLSSLLRLKYVHDDHREPGCYLTEKIGDLVKELFKSQHFLWIHLE